MFRQERLIIDTLLEARRNGKLVPYWDLVENVVRKFLNPGDRLRDGSIEVVALFNRLMREKKVTRDRRNYKCHIKLTDAYAAQLDGVLTQKPTETKPKLNVHGGVHF